MQLVGDQYNWSDGRVPVDLHTADGGQGGGGLRIFMMLRCDLILCDTGLGHGQFDWSTE